MPTARLSGAEIEYFTHGHGPERVVFLHGFQASAPIWSRVWQALPADLYSTLAINHRGAGRSSAPDDESAYSIPIFAADAAELTEQLGWNDFTLAGHSLGGGTAAQFAIDHPERLKGLFLLDPIHPDGMSLPAGADLDTLIDRRMAARRRHIEAGGGADGIDSTGAGVPAELLETLAAEMRAAKEARLRGSMRSMFSIRLGERLRALNLPVLLAGGDADALVPLASMLDAHGKCPPGSGLHIWHGEGHSPNLDTPLAVAQVLRRFIEVTIPSRPRGNAA